MAASKKEKPIIEVKHLSKQYNIGVDRTYKTFCDSFTSAVRHPLKTLKESHKPNDTFWALKDVNFEVERGDVVGIIGRNGAGKSTLLKILSRITYPTEGEITMRGRVGSLLEVGTGFHPELTGRENIYFNGAILGMKKREIDEKFDEIVKFSGVEKFLGTPVKRYSSGMQVRLAFSVAANLDPEVLVVDEVLAVGDAVFQKKCLGKMSEVAEGGRTVLFVSHNMGAVKNLCEKCILLDKGRARDIGPTNEVIDHYLNNSTNKNINEREFDHRNQEFNFRKIKLTKRNERLICEISYEILSETLGACIVIKISNTMDVPILLSTDTDINPSNFKKKCGNYTTRIDIPTKYFVPDSYKITLSCADMKSIRFDYIQEAIFFEIIDYYGINSTFEREGLLNFALPWELIN